MEDVDVVDDDDDDDEDKVVDVVLAVVDVVDAVEVAEEVEVVEVVVADVAFVVVALAEVVELVVLVAAAEVDVVVELPWLGSSPTPATAPLSPPAKPGVCRTFTIRFASAARRCAGSLSPPLTLASADDRAKRNEMAKKSVKTSDLDANMADGVRAEVCSTVTGGCSAKSGGCWRGGGWEERKERQSAAQRAESCACDSSLRSKQRRGQLEHSTSSNMESRKAKWM